MNSKRLVQVCLLLFLSACNDQSKNSIVLNYQDFGPQAMAWRNIGMEWWQWQAHGDSDPKTKYNIKVVIYRNITLQKVKSLYPINQDKKQDYRFIEYTETLNYLNRNIQENVISDVTERLKLTKRTILKSLGK